MVSDPVIVITGAVRSGGVEEPPPPHADNKNNVSTSNKPDVFMEKTLSKGLSIIT
jgi:hypothetical protein